MKTFKQLMEQILLQIANEPTPPLEKKKVKEHPMVKSTKEKKEN